MAATNKPRFMGTWRPVPKWDDHDDPPSTQNWSRSENLQETAKNGRQNGVRFVSLHSIDHIFFDLLMSSITFSCLNPYFHVSIQHFPLFFVPPSWLFLELRSDQGWFGVGGRQAGLVLRPAAKAPGSWGRDQQWRPIYGNFHQPMGGTHTILGYLHWKSQSHMDMMDMTQNGMMNLWTCYASYALLYQQFSWGVWFSILHQKLSKYGFDQKHPKTSWFITMVSQRFSMKNQDLRDDHSNDPHGWSSIVQAPGKIFFAYQFLECETTSGRSLLLITTFFLPGLKARLKIGSPQILMLFILFSIVFPFKLAIWR